MIKIKCYIKLEPQIARGDVLAAGFRIPASAGMTVSSPFRQFLKSLSSTPSGGRSLSFIALFIGVLQRNHDGRLTGPVFPHNLPSAIP